MKFNHRAMSENKILLILFLLLVSISWLSTMFSA